MWRSSIALSLVALGASTRFVSRLVSSRLASSVCASTHLRVGLHQWSRADEDGSRSPSLEEREHHADAADTLCDPVKQYNLRPICLCLSVSLVCKIQNE